MQKTRRVTLGEDTKTIDRFRGFKALLAGELVADVLKETGEVGKRMAEIQRDLAEKNEVTLTRAAAEFRYGKEEMAVMVSEEAWEANDHKITLPGEVSTEAVIAEVFPEVFAAARDRVAKLLALVIIPDRDLERADDQGDEAVEELLQEKGKELLHTAYLDQIAELAALTAEAVRDQLGGDLRDRLGTAFKPFLRRQETEPQEEMTEESSQPSSPEMEPEDSSRSTSPTSEPTSSTDSPTGTDGPEGRPSSGSPGTTSPVSAGA